MRQNGTAALLAASSRCGTSDGSPMLGREPNKIRIVASCT